MMDAWIRLGKISRHEDPYSEFMVQCVPRRRRRGGNDLEEDEEDVVLKSGVRYNVGNLVVVRFFFIFLSL